MMIARNDPKFLELVTKGFPLTELERRLSPGGLRGGSSSEGIQQPNDSFSDYSLKGFLGADESLLDTVYADWTVVERYGTTHQEIAKLLAKAISENKVPNPEYTMELIIPSSDGVQRCPWECKGKGTGSSNLITIYHRLRQRNPAVVTELHPHLIQEHYFFEGKKTIYRADPEILIPALNLVQ